MPSYVVYVDGPGEHTVDVKPENEILYVTQMADLIDAFEGRYGDDSWETQLDQVQREEILDAVRGYMPDFNSGMYSWDNALSDAIDRFMFPNEGFPTAEEAADLQAIADGVAEAESRS